MILYQMLFLVLQGVARFWFRFWF